MNCGKIKKILDFYIEKELSGQTAEKVEKHLKKCPLCQKEMNSYNKIYNSIGKVFSPPDNFTQSVMARLTTYKKVAAKPKKRGIFFNFIFQNFYWKLAGAAVSIFLFIILYRVGIKEDFPPPLKETETITFTLYMPDAQSVWLVGDFNRWSPADFHLEDEYGHWKITVSLKQGRYQYGFIVNGSEWIADPKAERFAEDGFGGRNAIIVIEI